MPEDYRKVVLAAYENKKLDGSLSPNLSAPTPGDLREECLIVYRERQHNPNDLEILRQFFGPKDQEKGYFYVIENSRAQKFKQMPKILKGKVTNPGIKFIELLAWLIDFQPRTSISYYNSFDKQFDKEKREITNIIDVKINETQNGTVDLNREGEKNHENEVMSIDQGANEHGDLVEIEKKESSGSTNIKVIEQSRNKEKIITENPPKTEYIPRFSTSSVTISCIILLFIGSSSFVAWENSPTTVRMPNSDEKCMYWDEDHYEPINCERTIANATIIPLNLKVLKKQQKITLPDTLTSYSLGKVWYKGFVKDHEFFTDSGTYPLDTQRVLKPLSSLILTKYTSNYRHLFTRLAWFLCAAFFVGLCGYGVSKLEKEVKSKDKLQENDIKEKLSASETNEVMNGAELKVVKV
ncbi:hypothetical protein [Pedobacter miscanthi]|uniref:Uncharacterized protein n=1 Tax=Pedobacter miscanthi TaxID=2259170 RepID=A0A366KXJ8_9SPHI|nr:hypothetical protein [Pedobacter miscanthi]RBQ05814.1 hypothetical protein DRW42_15045 [Pedobacter miscanthi]